MTRPVLHQTMQQAGAGLDKLVAGSLHRARANDAPMLAWPVACGHAVAQRTRALDFVDGILRVEVPDAGWRSELKGLAPRYLAAINRYVSKNVSRIEFVVSNRVSNKDASRPPSQTAHPTSA